jgi:hypothetical protein
MGTIVILRRDVGERVRAGPGPDPEMSLTGLREGRARTAAHSSALEAYGRRMDRPPPRQGDVSTGASGAVRIFTGPMADLAFVLLTIAVFGLLALVVKGVERL